MRLYTAEEMSRSDRGAQDLGIPGGVLMERAGAEMARVAREAFAPFAPRRALVVAGGGNNGGDGFVVARELHRAGAEVSVLATKEGYDGDTGTNLEVLRNLGVRFVAADEIEAELESADLVIDSGLASPGRCARGRRASSRGSTVPPPWYSRWTSLREWTGRRARFRGRRCGQT
jgi:hydroxyethylthiazole kinase-like uncharacterized protein yjeF